MVGRLAGELFITLSPSICFLECCCGLSVSALSGGFGRLSGSCRSTIRSGTPWSDEANSGCHMVGTTYAVTTGTICVFPAVFPSNPYMAT